MEREPLNKPIEEKHLQEIRPSPVLPGVSFEANAASGEAEDNPNLSGSPALSARGTFVARLFDPRLQGGQRRALASQLGQTGGNQYLQRAAQSSQPDEEQNLTNQMKNSLVNLAPSASGAVGTIPSLHPTGSQSTSTPAAGVPAGPQQTTSNAPAAAGPANTQSSPIGTSSASGENGSAQEALRNVDRTKLDSKKNELKPNLDTGENLHSGQQTQVRQVSSKAASEADKPGKTGPAGKQGEGGPHQAEGKATGKGAEAVHHATHAASIVDQAAAQPEPLQIPSQPPPVAFPTPVVPMDAKGSELPVDQAADAQVVSIAQRAQHLRAQGQRFRSNAAGAHSDSQAINATLSMARQNIAQAETGVQTVASHTAARREIMGQAQKALGVSEQKAEMVAKEAPGFAEKSEEGKQEAGPMAAEAKQKAAENAARTPDDAEAAGNSQEQGQKLNQVGNDAGSLDNAVTQTKAKAGTLAEDAAHATQMNAQTRGKISTMQSTLARTDQHLDEMRQHNSQARSQVNDLASQPAQMTAQAQSLDEEGQGLIQASQLIETQLQETQHNYLTGMQAVPGREAAAQPSPAPSVQRLPLLVQRAGYGDRVSVNLGGYLPSIITGQPEPSAQARQEARRRENERRRNQINQINKLADGHFERLGPGDKALIALRLTGQNLFTSVSNINVLEFGAHLLQGFVDPRMALSGVLGGLSMMASGVGNLFSAQQWERDPLGNLLKSSADIATGLTIVFGSISGLAGVIILLMGALEIFTLGLATPIAAPVIAFCTSVLAWTLPATIAVGKVALVLQALVLIKNLIDAATAPTAEALQTSADRVTEDVSNAGNVLLQIGGAKLGQKMMAHGPAEVPEEAIPPAPETAPELPPEPVEAPAEGVEVQPEPAPPAPETPEPQAPQPAPEPEPVGAQSGETPPASSEAPEPPTSESPSKPAEPAESSAAHPEEPQLEEGIAAKEKTVDGEHEIKITEDGRIVRCSSCGELEGQLDNLLEEFPENQELTEEIENLRDQLKEIEANDNIQDKMAAARQIEAKIADLRRSAEVQDIFNENQRLSPGEDTQGEGNTPNPRTNASSSPSELLEQNMIKAGLGEKPPGHAAHHIVAESDVRADVARDILAEADIPINDAKNGIYLPENPEGTIAEALERHETIHTDAYYEELTNRLTGAAEKGDVAGELARIKQDIANGNFPH